VGAVFAFVGGISWRLCWIDYTISVFQFIEMISDSKNIF
jgi:hypothetical protein